MHAHFVADTTFLLSSYPVIPRTGNDVSSIGLGSIEPDHSSLVLFIGVSKKEPLRTWSIRQAAQKGAR